MFPAGQLNFIQNVGNANTSGNKDPGKWKGAKKKKGGWINLLTVALEAGQSQFFYCVVKHVGNCARRHPSRIATRRREPKGEKPLEKPLALLLCMSKYRPVLKKKPVFVPTKPCSRSSHLLVFKRTPTDPWKNDSGGWDLSQWMCEKSELKSRGFELLCKVTLTDRE